MTDAQQALAQVCEALEAMRGDWLGDGFTKLHRSQIVAVLDAQAAEIERLTAALRAQPGPVSVDDVEWAGKVHLADCEASNQRLRAALVAAMEVVQQDRTDMYIGSVHARTGELAPEDAEAIARIDAIIAQADVVLKYNERREK